MSIISEYVNSCQCSKQGSLKINWCVCGEGCLVGCVCGVCTGYGKVCNRDWNKGTESVRLRLNMVYILEVE